MFPIELVAKILKYSLLIDHEEFFCPASKWPIDQQGAPPSGLLLVCKTWLRTATPFLYSTVVIRTLGQAHALLDALKGPSGKELAPYIQRLRLDGHFGEIMKEVFALTQQTTSLFIRVPLFRDEDVDGLEEALSLLKPTALYIDMSNFDRYLPNTRQFIKSLSSVHRNHWDLERIGIHSPSSSPDLLFLCENLAVKSLKRFWIMGDKIKTSDIDDIALRVSQSKLVEKILIYTPLITGSTLSRYDNVELHYISPKEQNSQLGRPERRENAVINGKDVFPVIHSRIFSKIFFFHIQSLVETSESQKYGAAHRKRLHELMSLASLYKKICISMQLLVIETMNQLIEHLFEYGPLNGMIEAIEIHKEVEPDNSMKIIERAFLEFTRLRNLTSPPQHTFYLPRLSSSISSKIETLTISRIHSNLCFKAISQLPNLNVLKLEYIECDVSCDKDNKGENIVLTNVQKLIIRGMITANSLPSLLACEFRSVRTLEFDLKASTSSIITFLHMENWGEETTILSCFPNLDVLNVKTFSPRVPYLSGENPSLRKIVVSGLYRGLTAPPEIRDFDHSVHKFRKLTLGKLRSLEEVQLMDVDEWPWMNHRILRREWIYSLGEFMKEYGIKVTNSKGVPFRARAKPREEYLCGKDSAK